MQRQNKHCEQTILAQWSGNNVSCKPQTLRFLMFFIFLSLRSGFAQKPVGSGLEKITFWPEGCYTRATSERHKNENCSDVTFSDQNSLHWKQHELATETQAYEFVSFESSLQRGTNVFFLLIEPQRETRLA